MSVMITIDSLQELTNALFNDTINDPLQRRLLLDTIHTNTVHDMFTVRQTRDDKHNDDRQTKKRNTPFTR